ncbi:prolyl oligopeptidase [Apodospora peruviana]|uniref:Dipeptidyl-peptidase V n=1 Tax=Apodospora peruviana TaxID=516989 RepID=A0AAE0HSY0_9PEZI|nr:prolyl oligopeptidase [Apodospora peruviana]
MDLTEGSTLGTSRLVCDSDSIHDAKWLGDGTNCVLFLQDGDDGITQVRIADADDLPRNPYLAGTIPAPVQGARLKSLPDGRGIAITVIGLAGSEDGSLYNEKTSATKASTGQVYDNFRVRMWKSYKKPQRYSIFYSLLTKTEGKWKLDSPLLHNAVVDDRLDDCPDGMYGGASADPTGKYDLNEKGITFVAIDPEVWREPKHMMFRGTDTLKASQSSTQGQASRHGFTRNVRFSPDGSKIAFLKVLYDKQAETRMFLAAVESEKDVLDVAKDVTKTDWGSVLPSSFEFAPSGDTIYFTSDDRGRMALYEIHLRRGAKPTLLLREGSVSGFYPLRDQALLVSSSSMVDPSIYWKVDLSSPSRMPSTKVISSVTNRGSSIGLDPRQITDVYFQGAKDFVHAPFDIMRKYPLALLIHGGPQYAWRDEWQPRLSPALFAAQGYVVVAPNISGSTGFGVEHTEGVNNSYGGRPYEDIVKCLEFLQIYPFIDLNNAVAAGESYGGYMMNWIQGNDLGRKFKALVTIDSVYNIRSMVVESDNLSGGPEFNGSNYPWVNNGEDLERWNPSNPKLLKNWTTPMLVIHNDRDYRLPVTEGIAAFTTLQMRGTPSRFLHFPDEGHFIQKPGNVLHWLKEIFAWVNKYSNSGAISN